MAFGPMTTTSLAVMAPETALAVMAMVTDFGTSSVLKLPLVPAPIPARRNRARFSPN